MQQTRLNFWERGLAKKVTKRRFQFFLAYTICYLILAYAIFSVFLTEQKSFVWVPDGLQQHFNALLYYRRWLREIVHTLFVEHQFSVKLWDIHIGMGSDVLTTLHYYVIGDPLNLLSVFVTDESYMELFYDGMILLRIYLAGLAFAAYCRFHGQRPYPTLLGSIVYAFCYWVIIAIRHPYFLNPMIYLPLILIGVDKIYQKKKPWLYIAMLAIATISSFYFAYMICIFIVIYVTLRYFMQYHHFVIKKDVFGWIGKFLLYSVIALLIASVILLPVVMMTLSTGRANTSTYLPVLYPLSYYKQLFVGFLIGGSSYWSELGYTGLQIITVVVLLMNRNRFKGLKAGVLFMTLLLLVPFAGHMLNGGSYVINRFMWAYSMLIAFVAVKMYPAIVDIRRKKKAVLLLVCLAYCYVCYRIYQTTEKTYILFALIMLLMMLTMIVLTSKTEKETIWFRTMFLFLIMGQLTYQGRMTYEPVGKDYVSEFAGKGEALELLSTQTAGSLVQKMNPEDDYRYESSREAELKNTAMQLGINGVSYYFSLANPYINQFQREMYINQTRDFCYSGFDGRTILDELAGVRYYVVKESESALCPYQYDELVDTDTLGTNDENEEQYIAFENKNVLSIGFSSNRYILRSDYDKMTVTQKQQALLQGIVLEDEAAAGLSLEKADVTFTDQDMPYTIAKEEGLTVNGNTIEVTDKNAVLTLKFKGTAESEVYLILEGLDYENEDNNTSRVHIFSYCGGVKKEIAFLSKKNKFYSGVDNILSNMGYHEEGVKKLKIRFKEPGTYSFDSMKIVCQPVSNLKEQEAALRADEIQNLTFADNEVSGTITTSEAKLLCMSLPYSDGFTAYVDGKKTDILRADSMYMAVYLPAGTHQISFVYCTPYLKEGILMTCIGILLLLGLIVWERRRGHVES